MANMERPDTTLIGPTIERIAPLDRAAMEAAQSRLDRLTKPQGSLGWLEELAVWLAGATADPTPLLPRKTVVVAAADHGVAAGGVSAYPQAVTVAMVQNFLAGGAAINVMARAQGATVTVVDAGVASVIEPPAGTSPLRFQSRRVGAGTADIRSGPAMSAEQAEQAVAHGMEVVAGLREAGVDIVATGDMGIGNTTASAAITSLWAEASVEEVTGRGTGIDEAGWQRKVAAVRDALEANRPDLSDGLDILQKIGGFEIGVLAGVILGGGGGAGAGGAGWVREWGGGPDRTGDRAAVDRVLRGGTRVGGAGACDRAGAAGADAVHGLGDALGRGHGGSAVLRARGGGDAGAFRDGDLRRGRRARSATTARPMRWFGSPLPALEFLTTLRLHQVPVREAEQVARSLWAFPLVGALIGLALFGIERGGRELAPEAAVAPFVVLAGSR